MLLLLVVGESVGDAPGDESCSAQGEQQVNIRVLMDSWRYQSLLSGSGSSSDAVWTSSDHVRSCHAIELWSILCSCNNSFVILPDSGGLVEFVQVVGSFCALENVGKSGCKLSSLTRVCQLLTFIQLKSL